MKPETKTRINGQIRHLLTAIGPLLVMFSITDEAGASEFTNTAMTAAGAIMALVGVVWSWQAPEKKG